MPNLFRSNKVRNLGFFALAAYSFWGSGESQEVQNLISTSSYETLTGLKGTYNEKDKVYKIIIPRNDIKVAIYEINLDSSKGLNSTISFTPINESQFLVMGELVLFQDEINCAMSALLNNNIDVSALHNHFLYDVPKVYFLHFSGKGTIGDLSKGIRNCLTDVSDVRVKNTSLPSRFGGTLILNKNDIDSNAIEETLGVKGQNQGGISKFTFGRNVKIHGASVGSEMGVYSWTAFGGSNENAVVDGEFAVKERELQSVLKILRKGNLEILAIHQRMTGEYPRMTYIHFWGKGKALPFAKTIRQALDVMSDKKTEDSDQKLAKNVEKK